MPNQRQACTRRYTGHSSETGEQAKHVRTHGALEKIITTTTIIIIIITIIIIIIIIIKVTL
jgi:hypothetical protein